MADGPGGVPRHPTSTRDALTGLVDVLPDAVRVIDADTFAIVEVNRADEELCGHLRAEIVGRDAREFWPAEPELRDRVEAHFAEARVRGTARAFALPFRARGGRIVPIDAHTRCVLGDDGQLLVVVAREATPRLALATIQQELAQLRAVRAVANGAAHEINNPLAVIFGSLDLLRGRVSEGTPEARWVERALAAAQRVHEIVSRLERVHAVERLRPHEGLAPALDLRRSSTPA